MHAYDIDLASAIPQLPWSWNVALEKAGNFHLFFNFCNGLLVE